jgi:SAM-dependent methyltransferase
MITLQRRKKRNILLSLAYKLRNFIPMSPEKKLKLFLDLSWIFSRLAHEQIFKTKIRITENIGEDFLVNKIPVNATVLDIGCGSGYIADAYLRKKTENIIGIDYDQAAIERAKYKFKNTKSQFYCIDVFQYLNENPDKKFDVFVLSHLLEHIDQPGDFLNKLQGRADYYYIEVPDFEVSNLNLYRQLVGTDLVYTDADHVSEFDRKSLEALIHKAGLKIEDSEFKFGVIKYWCAGKK